MSGQVYVVHPPTGERLIVAVQVRRTASLPVLLRNQDEGA
jgi:hypothetical protein